MQPTNVLLMVSAAPAFSTTLSTQHFLGRSQHDVPAHDEIAPLGVNVIEALRIVSRLEQLGLDKQEISLPKCIVLGMF